MGFHTGVHASLRRLTPLTSRRNLYGGSVEQPLIMSQMDGMASRARSVNGVPTSLLDLGFKDVGLDVRGQACARSTGAGHSSPPHRRAARRGRPALLRPRTHAPPPHALAG